MEEIWRLVDGYGYKYEVSNLGNIRSLNYLGHGNIKQLTPGYDTKGYLKVNLYFNGKSKSLLVHRLVAIAFIPNPCGRPFIDHVNAIRDDNTLNNLKWCTRKENQNNPICRNRQKEASRTSIKKIKTYEINLIKGRQKSVKINQYSKEGSFLKTFNSLKEAASQLGIPSSSICCCCRGIMKYAGGFSWDYYVQ
jgi:hypothetical protein